MQLAFKKTPPRQTRSPCGGRSAATKALIIGALVLGAVFSAPWWVATLPLPDIRRPQKHARPPKPVPPADAWSAADRKAVQEAINRFDLAEGQRRLKSDQTTKNLSRTRSTAVRKLTNEAAMIAKRMASLGFATNLLTAKARAKLPTQVGGDPLAPDRVIAEAVGVRGFNIQANYKEEAGKAVAQFAAKPKVTVPMLGTGSGYQTQFGKYIIRATSREISASAKSGAVRVLRRAVTKLPVTALDGPLPGAEIALFGLTVVDLYRQGVSAQKGAQQSIFASAMNANNAELERVTNQATREIAISNELLRRGNCAGLLSAYRRTAIVSLRTAVSDRCRSMDTR
jgi:hypothetical protein